VQENAAIEVYRAQAGEAVAVPVPTVVSEAWAAERARPLRRRRTWLSRLLLVHADAFALLVAFFAAERLFDAALAPGGGFTSRGALFLLTLPVWLVGMKAAGLYDRDDELIHHSTLDEVPSLLRVATVGVWLFALASWLTATGVSNFGQLICFWVLAAALLPTVRAVVRWDFRRDPDFAQNTVIVGAGSVGQLLGRKFLQHPEYRVNLLGFVDAAPRERREDLDDLTILGTPDDLPALADRLQVERVVIAFSNDSHEETMDLIRLLKDLKVRIDIVPRLFDVIPPRLTSHTIEGVPLLTLPSLRLSASARVLKRTLDLAVSGAGLLVISPLFLGLAALIKLDSRGPVFFRQLRMGEGDRPFLMLKFRTMVVDADARKSEVAHLNRHARPGGDPRMFKAPRDPRVTRVGQFLRRYSLDELPQLLNVVKGNMSLIGPRPLILEEDRFVESWARKRLLLKPGMTGLWQVLGRSAIPFEEMVKLDYLYVTTWSLANDCRLLVQTIPLVFKGERDGYY
jgi:exopolysaccharide biosynthesis polyprenyl glycosylphosphotransferase